MTTVFYPYLKKTVLLKLCLQIDITDPCSYCLLNTGHVFNIFKSILFKKSLKSFASNQYFYLTIFQLKMQNGHLTVYAALYSFNHFLYIQTDRS